MAFDFGFDFRDVAGAIADPPYASKVLIPPLDVYPTTFSNANGDSINAGRVSAGGTFSLTWNAANDPRIAGSHYGYMAGDYFQVDLNSGSAPGAGAYSVDIAVGQLNTKQDFSLYDNAALLIDGTNGGALYDFSATGTDNYIDASLNFPIAASVAWTGTPRSVTFASNTAKFFINQIVGSNTFFQHLRFTAATGGGGGGAGACECSYFHSFEYREVSDFMDCVVGRRS